MKNFININDIKGANNKLILKNSENNQTLTLKGGSITNFSESKYKGSNNLTTFEEFMNPDKLY
jgi:hypothetical protein